MPNVTKDDVLLYLKILIEDFEALKAGTWVPDEASCDASIEMSERIQAFLEGLPCDS